MGAFLLAFGLPFLLIAAGLWLMCCIVDPDGEF